MLQIMHPVAFLLGQNKHRRLVPTFPHLLTVDHNNRLE